MSGLGGTTLTEVNVISITPDVALSILNLLLWNDAEPRLRTHLLSFLLLVTPMVLQLLGPMSPAWVFVGLMFWLVLILMSRMKKISQLWKQSYDWELCFKRSLTIHRALVMLITCVAILAVDFHAFPRRFAKTEYFGTGLMDAGVGSMVAAGAFVQGMRYRTSTQRKESKYISFNKLVQTMLLVALGLSRFVATELINYQKHVGEYGIHWNFFLTLAVVRVVRDFIIRPLGIYSSHVASFVVGFIILCTHQALLSVHLIDLINAEGDRGNLILANKEGIFSLPGYIALDLLGAACGAVMAWIYRNNARRTLPRVVYSLVFNILLWTVFFSSALIQPVSRRACNAPYVLWILSLNVQSVLLGLPPLIIAEKQAVPPMLEAVNNSMLPTFLLANLLTGGVNILIDTLEVGNVTARGILLVYMMMICSFSLLFDRYRELKLKEC